MSIIKYNVKWHNNSQEHNRHHIAHSGGYNYKERILLANLVTRPRYRCEDNIKVDLIGIGCMSVNWIRIVYNWVQSRALAKTVINLDKGYRMHWNLTVARRFGKYCS